MKIETLILIFNVNPLPYDLSMWPRIALKHGTEHWQQLITSLTRIVYLWSDLKTRNLTGVVYIWFDRRTTRFSPVVSGWYAEKWSPEKWSPGKTVPRKIIPGKMVPENNCSEKWSPEK